MPRCTFILIHRTPDKAPWLPTACALLALSAMLGLWKGDAPLLGQTPAPASVIVSSTLVGSLHDPVGYLIPHAQLTLTPAPPGQPLATTSDAVGSYRFSNLSPGVYTLVVRAAGFADLIREVVVNPPPAPASLQLDLALRLPPAEIKLEVSDSAADISNPEHNGSALSLRPDDLAVLSDDPATLQQQLQAIAGPSPDGVRFYIDGFEATRLPPKSDIREVRVNSNLYSAQYDSAGLGRVEIFTRPGGGKLSGGIFASVSGSALNAQDPFTPQPDYSNTAYNASLNGPLGRHLSTNTTIFRRADDDSAIVNATVLDSGLSPVSLLQAVPNPHTQNLISSRLDLQAPHHTSVTLRYSFSHDTQDQGGVGGLNLATQAYRLDNDNHILQLLATNALGAGSVNELRLQYTRTRNNQFAASTEPTVAVQGAFIGGGAINGTNRDNQDTYELQDFFSHAFKKSFLRFGGRFRVIRDANLTTANFNGQYTFATISAYKATLAGLAAGLSPAQIRAQGGGASLFSLTGGTPSVAVSRIDGAVYAEDDWKITPRLTASLGLRLESQNVMRDHLDLAPRLALGYVIRRKGSPFLVLRAGSGVFYQRFPTSSQLRAARQNGIVEQQYLIQNPDTYPAIPTPTQLGTELPTSIWQVDPDLRAPYSIYSGAGIDRQFGRSGSLSINFNSVRLLHAFETRNVNAPLPGTYDPPSPSSGVRPLGGSENIFRYGSEGVSNQEALRVNGSYRHGHLSLTAYYSLTFNMADTNGSFPSNSYNQHADYGRAANDLRHQLYLYSTLAVPLGVTLSTNMLVHSGAPFNIVVGQDLNGDTQYNDRPTYATDLTRPTVVRTRWGVFDTAPMAGQRRIPMNLGTGPSVVQVDMRLVRSFGIGPRLAPPPVTRGSAPRASAAIPARRRFGLECSVYGENIFNIVNLELPNGTLGTPLFGRSTADQGARKLTFATRFSF